MIKHEKELVKTASSIFSSTGGEGNINPRDITEDYYKQVLPDYLNYVFCGSSRVVASCHYETIFDRKPDNLEQFGKEVVLKFPIYGEAEFSSGLHQNSHELKIWRNSNEEQAKCLLPILENNSTRFLVFPKVEIINSFENDEEEKIKDGFREKGLLMVDSLATNACKHNGIFKIIDYGYNVSLI